MAEPIDTAFVEILPDFRRFSSTTRRGIQSELAGVAPGAIGGAASAGTTGIKNTARDAMAADSAMARLRKNVTGTTGAYGLLGTTASRSATVATAGTLGVVAATGLVVKDITQAGIQFESAFAGVRKTVSGSRAELGAIRQDFIDLSTEIPVTTTELAAIGEEAGALGIQTGGITDFTKTVAELGVTTNLTSDIAADALARLANITQLPQDQFDNLGSTIVALGNKTASTEAEIVDFGLRISGAGTQIGLSQDQILAFGAALASVGLNAEAGGTAISTTFIKIASTVAKGGKQLDAFAAVAGESASEFAVQFKTAPAEAVVAFLHGLARIKQEGGNVFGTLDQLGLGGIRVRDALLRASSSGDLLSDSLRIGNQAWQSNNALQKEAATRFGTTASQIQVAKNQVSALAIELSGPFVRAVGISAQAIGGLAGGIRIGVQALKNLGGGNFDTVNADMTDLVNHLEEVQGEIDKLQASGGEDVTSGLTRDSQKTVAAIREIVAALNDTPAGMDKIVRIFSTASPQIRQAIVDGIITPAEQGAIQTTALGREFLRALPPDMFQEIPGAIKSSLEDAGAQAKAGAVGLGASLRSSIEDASRVAVQAAAAGGTEIGQTLAASIAQAATRAVGRANVVSAVQDEAVDAAIASGSRADQLAALKKKRDALANAISKIEAISHPGKARVDQRRELRSQLAQVTQQIDSIEQGIVSDQQAAKAESERRAREAADAIKEKDRALVDALGERAANAQNRVTRASGTETLKDDLAANIVLRDTLKGIIETVRNRIKDAGIRRDTLRTLRQQLTGVKTDIANERRGIAQDTREAIQTRIESRGEALADITQIAELRGDKSGQQRALQAEISFWRGVALNAKKGSKAQREAILAFEQKRSDLRNLLKKTTEDTTTGGTTLADLFTQQTGIARGAGVDVGPQISGQVTQPIENEVFRRLQTQASLGRGKLSVDAAITGQPKPDPQIDRLIAALTANTAAVAGNTGSGGAGGMNLTPGEVVGKRYQAAAQYYQAQARRKAQLDHELASG